MIGTTYTVDVDGVPTEVNGNIYSAVFSGGNVGIGTTQPEASLHVIQEDAEEDILRVDSLTQNYRLVVDNDGKVGLGTNNPEAQLHVVADTNNVDSLFIVSNNQSVSFEVKSSGIGINSSAQDGYGLYVKGDSLFNDPNGNTCFIY